MFIDFFFFYYYYFYLLRNCTLPKPHLVSCGGKKTCELEQTCHISFLGFQLREQSLGSAHWEIAMKL